MLLTADTCTHAVLHIARINIERTKLCILHQQNIIHECSKIQKLNKTTKVVPRRPTMVPRKRNKNLKSLNFETNNAVKINIVIKHIAKYTYENAE